MSDWNESDHSRGQPDNAGQFVEKDGQNGQYTGEGKSWRQGTIYEEILAADKKKKTNIDLTLQEWAMFYDRIGKIKKEGHYIPKTKKGKIIIPIETNKSNIVIIASGTYAKPEVKYAIRCKSHDYMYEIIARLKNL